MIKTLPSTKQRGERFCVLTLCNDGYMLRMDSIFEGETMDIRRHCIEEYEEQEQGPWTKVIRVRMDAHVSLRFIRHELIIGKGKTVVVSTVGRLFDKVFGVETELGYNRFYETVAVDIAAYRAGLPYLIDVTSPTTIPGSDATEFEVTRMHEAVLDEVIQWVESSK